MALSRRERREQRWKLLKQQRQEELKASEASSQLFQKKEYKGLLGIYDRHYMLLLIIPLLIFMLSVAQVGYQIYSTGDFLVKGVALKGGVTITVPVTTPVNLEDIDSYLSSQLPGVEIDVRSATELGVQKAIIITTGSPESEQAILNALETKVPGAKVNASAETTGEALGSSFFKETMKAMIFAFIFMGIVVFLSFRTFAPSVMVISCVIVDIIETIAAANLLGVNFSGAGIAALLMLIGYSVDTDILLTTRVMKNKEGTVFQRTLGAAKTGLMLTATALIAVTVSLILTQNETIKEIMIIMLAGLILDIINTWITNTALLRYYLEKIRPRRQAKKAAKEQQKESARWNDEKKDAADLGIDIEEATSESEQNQEEKKQ